MATPHASGVAAMIWSENGIEAWKASDVRTQLTATTDELGPSGRDTCFGYGRVNLAKALGVTEDPGAIAGAVTDASNKAGIGGATVDCESGGKATTAGNGSYTISNAPVGTHTCTASAIGYRSKSQSVPVSSGQMTTADFALRKR